MISILPYLKYSPCIILWRLNVKGVSKGLPGCDFWKRILRRMSFAKSNNFWFGVWPLNHPFQTLSLVQKDNPFRFMNSILIPSIWAINVGSTIVKGLYLPFAFLITEIQSLKIFILGLKISFVSHPSTSFSKFSKLFDEK